MNTDSAGIRRKIGVEMRGGVFSEVEAETEEREGLAGGGANDGSSSLSDLSRQERGASAK
jgi:hypothetical protein